MMKDLHGNTHKKRDQQKPGPSKYQYTDLKCNFCNKQLIWDEINRNQRSSYYRYKRVNCSSECAQKYKCYISSITLTKTNKKYASERMKKNNPSFLEETLRKVRETKIKNNNLRKAPVKQGGNGREIPFPVKMLSEKINYQTNYIVKTGVRCYYPTHYKLELANPNLKIAIEIDGNSHYSRKEESEKKKNYLENLGWKVIRFKNIDILKNLEICANVVKEEERKRPTKIVGY